MNPIRINTAITYIHPNTNLCSKTFRVDRYYSPQIGMIIHGYQIPEPIKVITKFYSVSNYFIGIL